MQCVQCNTDNRVSAKFCKHCGAKIPASQTAASLPAASLPGAGLPDANLFVSNAAAPHHASPHHASPDQSPDQSPPKTNNDLLSELVGLDELKEELSNLQAILEGMRQNNSGAHYPYNTIIVGASGTAKTLISELIAGLFLNFGMITKNRPEKIDSDALEGMDPDALDKLFSNAKGGMLFIDNAHKLVDTEGKARPAFSQFINKMDSCKNDPVVLMAGLPFGLREFVKNPENKNITGRFQNIFFIPDYSPAQYVEITENELKKQGFSFGPGVSEHLLKRFRYLYKELKKPDSVISAVNGYLAIKEAQSITGAYYMRRASDKIILPEDIKGQFEEKKSLQEIMSELDSIIGMNDLKKEIKSLYTQLNQISEMEKKGVKIDKPAQHFVITGNPGTGKTTVARIMGKIFEGLGLLDSGHVVEVDRSKLVAGYIGQTAPLTNKACDSAMGGILFIDEAYSLAKGSNNDFGQECIDTLLKRMEDDRGKFMVIAAGYKGPMEQFLTANEGLKSRFTKYFSLADYTPEELAAIFESLAAKQSYIVPPETSERVVAFFKDRCGRKTRDFANGREARNLMDEARKNQAERLSNADIASMAKEDSLTFLPEDIPATTAEKMVSIDEALKDLNELIGLKSVKDAVRKIANSLQAQKLTGESETLAKHFVFCGNPGTGKTTVARIMGDVFKAVGMLPTNNLVEADRGKLVASYVGQTAKLVAGQCDNAMGGILFIDEAYALKQGYGDSFGQEAVDTLLKRMEDDRGKFVVIAAGYTKEMDEFLASNSGFKSRFSDYITFDDYNPEEMREIFMGMCKKKKIEFAPGFDDALGERLGEIYAGRTSSFANARTVRQLFDKTRENVSGRAMALQDEEERKREIFIMRPEDLDMTVS
jgi:SpoVK/Ycf46/Vps4 family AAA+-type ATPase